jgi:hypothetical protein
MSRFLPPDVAKFSQHTIMGAFDAFQTAALAALDAYALTIENTEFSAQPPQPGQEGIGATTSARVDIFGRLRWRSGAPSYVCSFDAAKGGTANAPTITLNAFQTVSPAPQWAGPLFVGGAADDVLTTLGVVGSW